MPASSLVVSDFFSGAIDVSVRKNTKGLTVAENYTASDAYTFTRSTYNKQCVRTPNGIEYTDLFLMYCQLPMVRACVDALVRDTLTSPRLVPKTGKSEVSSREKAIFDQFWNEPVNNQYTGMEIIKRAIFDAVFYDELFIEEAVSPLGPQFGVEFYNSDARYTHKQISLDGKGKITGWVQWVNGKEIFIPVDKMFYRSVRYVGSRDRGIPPLAACWYDVINLVSAKQAQSEYYSSSATPMAIAVYGGMSDEQFEAHRKYMKEREKDPQRYRNRLIEVQAGEGASLHVAKLGDSITEAGSSSSILNFERSIQMVFGVPSWKLGLMENAKASVADIQATTYYDTCDQIQKVINSVGQYMLEKKGIKFARFYLPSPREEDTRQQIINLSLLHDKGVIATNEFRIDIGREPFPEEEYDRPRKSSVVMGQANNPNSQTQTQTSDEVFSNEDGGDNEHEDD